MSLAKSTRTETDDEQLKAAYQAAVDELGATLPPYLTLDMKVNKTGIKEYEKETGILPAGVEKVENWSLRIK
jgi:hypothetical protein